MIKYIWSLPKIAQSSCLAPSMVFLRIMWPTYVEPSDDNFQVTGCYNPRIQSNQIYYYSKSIKTKKKNPNRILICDFSLSAIYTFYLKFNMTIIQNVFKIFHLQETKLNYIYLIHVDNICVKRILWQNFNPFYYMHS